MGAANVELGENDRWEINKRCQQVTIVGERYAPEMMALINQ